MNIQSSSRQKKWHGSLSKEIMDIAETKSIYNKSKTSIGYKTKKR
jgi:hypothetical protein